MASEEVKRRGGEVLVYNLVTLDWKVGVVRFLAPNPSESLRSVGSSYLGLSVWTQERTNQKLKPEGRILKGQAAKKSGFLGSFANRAGIMRVNS